MEGAKGVTVNGNGELEADTELGAVRFTKPVAYQEIDGKRVDVAVEYELYATQQVIYRKDASNPPPTPASGGQISRLGEADRHIYQCCYTVYQRIQSQFEKFVMGNGVEILGDVGIYYLGISLVQVKGYVLYRLMGVPLRSEPVGILLKVRLKDGFYDQLCCHLDYPVLYRRYPQWPLAYIALSEESFRGAQDKFREKSLDN